MKQTFNQFAIRFLTAILCGVFLLLLHSVVGGGPLAVFVPRQSSAWELSKLAFWPLALTALLTGRKGHQRASLPALVLTPLALASNAIPSLYPVSAPVASALNTQASSPWELKLKLVNQKIADLQKQILEFKYIKVEREKDVQTKIFERSNLQIKITELQMLTEKINESEKELEREVWEFENILGTTLFSNCLFSP